MHRALYAEGVVRNPTEVGLSSRAWLESSRGGFFEVTLATVESRSCAAILGTKGALLAAHRDPRPAFCTSLPMSQLHFSTRPVWLGGSTFPLRSPIGATIALVAQDLLLDAHPNLSPHRPFPMSAFIPHAVHRLLIWTLVVQQALAGVGVRLPLGIAAKASAERYPCEGCGCGCQSAEQCWRQCCCYTNREKLAWAERHGVAAPEYVVVAAERESATKPKTLAKAAACPHCADAATAEDAASAPAHARRSAPGISWIEAMRCQGGASYWQSAVPALPLRLPPRPDQILLAVGRINAESFLENSLSPPAPPTPPPEAA
jgi:hypothetical protein